MVDESDGRILQVALAQGNEHDLTLARQQTQALPFGSLCVVDLGYQGLSLDGSRVVWPFKKPKHGVLEPEQQAFNRCLARVRIKVEHCIRGLKVFRLLKGVYRGRRRRFDLRLNLIAAFINRMITT